jgi:hypothetical protein
VQGNSICVEIFSPSTDVEKYRAVWLEQGFHSAMLAMMRRWWFTWLGIFCEMMTLKILYHCDHFSRRLHVELIDGALTGVLPPFTSRRSGWRVTPLARSR